MGRGTKKEWKPTALTLIFSSQQNISILKSEWTATACEMHDLKYHSAHEQMAQSQQFRKSEIWLDTGSKQNITKQNVWSSKSVLAKGTY